MATTTIYANTDDNYLISVIGTNTAAQGSAASTGVESSVSAQIGWARTSSTTTSYRGKQMHLRFNTATIPADAIITNVYLKFKPGGVAGGTVTVHAYPGYDFTPSGLTIADWRTPAQLNALGSAGSVNVSNGETSQRTITFSTTNINRSGDTFVVLVTSDFMGGGTLTASTFREITIDSGNDVPTDAPQLEITYEQPPDGEYWFVPTMTSVYVFAGGASGSRSLINGNITGNGASSNSGVVGMYTDGSGNYANHEVFITADTTSLAEGWYSATLRLYLAGDNPNIGNHDAIVLDHNAGSSHDAGDYLTLAETQALTEIDRATVTTATANETLYEFDITDVLHPGASTGVTMVTSDFLGGTFTLGASQQNYSSFWGPTAGNPALRPRVIVVETGPPPGFGTPIGPGTLSKANPEAPGTLWVRKNGAWVRL